MNNGDFSRYSKRLVQLFWDPEPKNDDMEGGPIWCLGRRYTARPGSLVIRTTEDRGNTSSTQSSTASESAQITPLVQSTVGTFEQLPKLSVVPSLDDTDWPKDFLEDFESRLWFTYRSNFTPISKSEDPKAANGLSIAMKFKSQLSGQTAFTSDTGWGCMIRSGQSVLANALLLLQLGRDWRKMDNITDNRLANLLQLFADDPAAPFSIHRFVEHGAIACGTHPGQWFGPSATAKCIEALTQQHQGLGLKVLVISDGLNISEEAVFGIAKSNCRTFNPTLVLVGTRLGIDRVTPAYWDALMACLQLPQSVGIAGGRPSSSHYFVGTQGSTLFYLDPHTTRPALPFRSDPATYTADELASCHTRRLRRLPISEVDPSMLIAFLFRDETDWQSWRSSIAEAPGKAIFHVAPAGPTQYAYGKEREGALDEVETLDDEGQDEFDDCT